MISEAFVRNGARVYIASRDAAACTSACAELNALPGITPGGSAIPLPADLSSLEECQRLAKTLAARESKLRMLSPYPSPPPLRVSVAPKLAPRIAYLLPQELPSILQSVRKQTADNIPPQTS
jgi:NAD(P)-dependent dehydrogenase (short-subunit alcohol dehydrogenase family)